VKDRDNKQQRVELPFAIYAWEVKRRIERERE